MRKEIILRFSSDLEKQVRDDLERPHEFASERVGFISASHIKLSSGKYIIFLKEYFLVPDEFYINDPLVGARINSSAIHDALQRIIDTKKGSFHVHLHSFQKQNPEFSKTDLKDNPEIVKAFSFAGRDQIHGMIIFGAKGFNALVKVPGDTELIQVSKITSIGYPMKISTPKNKYLKSTERYNRQSFLGLYSQNTIQNIRIGIIGLGGGGSHIVQQLAHLGIQKYVLFDYDSVDESNLNRMIGARQSDLNPPQKKIVVAKRLIDSLHADAEVKIIEDNWANSPENLQECDIVFGCVDSYISRRDIESECRRYLIPYIDIGMDVYNDHNQEPPSMVGQIIVSIPGKICMHCMGFINETNLAKEAAKYGAVGGRPQVVWSNGVLASQAVGLFIELITGWSGRKEICLYYGFDGNQGTLSFHPRLKFIEKPCLHYRIQDVGPPTFRDI